MAKNDNLFWHLLNVPVAVMGNHNVRDLSVAHNNVDGWPHGVNDNGNNVDGSDGNGGNGDGVVIIVVIINAICAMTRTVV